MPLRLSLLLTFALAAFITVCTSYNYTCVEPNNSTLFARDDYAALCVHIAAWSDGLQTRIRQRAAYPIQVDQFTSVQIQGGQGNFSQYSYVQLMVQVHGTVQTFPLTYIYPNQSFYSSAFSIVIEIDEGQVISAVWDHQCATCEYDDCLNFNLINQTIIDQICNNPNCQANPGPSCDPQIYVTWIGSDVNGEKMQSAGMRPSRFRRYSQSQLNDAPGIPTLLFSDSTDDTSDEIITFQEL